MTGLAVDPDVAFALLDDAVRRREAEAGALPDFLGGEERLEQTPLRLFVHAGAGVRYRQHHVPPGHHHFVVKDGVLERDVLRFDRDAPAAGHRVARVHHEVHHDLLEMAAIAQRHRQRWRQRELDVEMLADQPAQHAGHVRDQHVDIEVRRVHHLLAAEGQQLLRQPGGAPGRLDDLAEIRHVLLAERLVPGDELGETENDGQQVVEVMRDA